MGNAGHSDLATVAGSDMQSEEWSALAFRSVVASAVKVVENPSDARFFESLKKIEYQTAPLPEELCMRNEEILASTILRFPRIGDASIEDIR